MNMNRGTLRFTHHALLAVGTLGAALSAEAATLNVNAAGANCAGADGTAAKPFCTIQAAVTKAVSGDTVQVAAGIYYEDVGITNKSLKVFGADPATTTVQGISIPFNIYGFTLAGSVEIAGLTITSSSSIGIDFDSDNLTGWVHNCIISNNPTGIYVHGANVKVTNNVIYGSVYQAIGAFTYNNSTRKSSTINAYNNILLNNGTGIYANSYFCGEYAQIYSSYNRYNNNSKNRDYSNNCSGGAFVNSTNDTDNSDPKFVDANNGDYTLLPGSPAVDAGRPGATDKDPDGTRNDQGVYGGPGATTFWPKAAGGLPVVTGLASSPHDVAVGGTFTITGTGKAQ
ncbi:DUF5123 domain-containing protein [Methylomagnum ishizawai]|uniref:DUF5123 domain-containing protein n=1 Tax=Methylomagnum ishizawai TaxID=1760988 RepID=UPI001C3432C5|nr:DUF5123 domain-containing protein [Methylomagnum ishizawai]BBL76817.1 hypothetical protein MishRS11D_39150 [Methylomagnum ishizawai]